MRKAARIGGVALAAILFSGLTACGGDSDESAEGPGGPEESGESSPQPEAETTPEQQTEATEGMDGAWESIVEDNPIAGITISGEQVTTTGPLSCPGTLSTEASDTLIELECEPANASRATGSVELDADGGHLFISWDGPAWGGMFDSFTRAG